MVMERTALQSHMGEVPGFEPTLMGRCVHLGGCACPSPKCAPGAEWTPHRESSLSVVSYEKLHPSACWEDAVVSYEKLRPGVCWEDAVI